MLLQTFRGIQFAYGWTSEHAVEDVGGPFGQVAPLDAYNAYIFEDRSAAQACQLAL